MAAYYKVDVSLSTNSVTVGAPSAQEVLVTLPLIGPAGATGATGPAGSGIEILTTQGDLLYRGAAAGERLPIGTSGQVLKVSASGIPAWGAESGAVSSVAGRTGAVTLAVADVANAVSTTDARLSDARTPSSTLAHASSHHTGGTDALAVRDLGGISVETRSSVSYSTDQTLSAARNTRLFVSNTNASGINLDLPIGSAGALEGDTYAIVGGSTVSGPIIIRRCVFLPTTFIEIARITAAGQSFTLRAAGGGTGAWEVVGVNTHTHVAADITGLPTASTTTPAALGTAAVGTGTTFARADHVHAMPTAAAVGAAQAVTDIELTPDGTTTITTAQLPARGIAFSDGEATFTVNLPTPDIRQSGLTFSVKSEYEAGSGPNFVTVVHAAVNLLTTYELDETAASIDFTWDGYAWTYSSAYNLRSFPGRMLQLPAASGTIARTEDFAAPPAIGSTTPNTGAFTTLSANSGTLTASAPVLNLAQTWNNSAVTFTGIRANFTDTASAAASLLMDWQVGGSSVSRIAKNGAATFRSITINDNHGMSSIGGSVLQVNVGGSGNCLFVNNRLIIGPTEIVFGDIFETNAVRLIREAAHVLALRQTTNAQTFRLYNTFTDASNYERGFMRWSSNVLQIGTEAAGTGTARTLSLQSASLQLNLSAGGGSPYVFNGNGEAVSPFSWVVPAAGAFRIDNRARITAPADSVLLIRNNAGTDFSRLQLGGTTSSFPALKRDTTTLQVRLADDTDFAPLACAGLTLNGDLTASTRNIVTDITTGTKIGTATTQKIGFFNATPVVQQSAVADATDAATVITQLNDLLARLRTLGLIAT